VRDWRSKWESINGDSLSGTMNHHWAGLNMGRKGGEGSVTGKGVGSVGTL